MDKEKDLHEKPSLEFEVPDGGFEAWCTVFGACVVWPLVQASKLNQTDYYVRVYLPNHSPSSIAWIGSFQLMMPFFLGPIAGRIFDDGGFRLLEIVGGSIFTFSVFMLSLCKPGQYYQSECSQAVGMGIGLGLTFVPTISIVVHHFKRHRGLTSGIVLSGSSLGATFFPISVQLLPKLGFSNAIRASGALVPPCIVIGNLMMRTRLPPRSKREGNTPPLDIKSFFVDPAYMLGGLGTFLALLGIYFPVVYIQLYAVQHNLDKNLAFYSVPILNASGGIARVLANHLGDLYGPFNVQVVCSVICGAVIWGMSGVNNGASLVVVSIIYGAASGAFLSLGFACFSSLAKGPEEVGARAGIALALCSIGTLVSTPIQGALLTGAYHWIRPTAFAAVGVDTLVLMSFPLIQPLPDDDIRGSHAVCYHTNTESEGYWGLARIEKSIQVIWFDTPIYLLCVYRISLKNCCKTRNIFSRPATG
ncbi:major facilitator superfamily domain-containing protein [Mycena belliarum]|uniref:Major facilitator superfamily domain-containing protein n=1 Tax=Mycena belliarum TaxID=1033014 RepID=A0AAD6TTH7_9AGAR|nr:major facilitator superfamily domain-containing protein [Mycena belliae]